MRQQCLQLNLEELRDKRCRQVQHYHFTSGRSRLGDFHSGLDTVRQKVSFDVEEFRAREELLDFRLGEVVWGEGFGSSEGSNEGSIVP